MVVGGEGGGGWGLRLRRLWGFVVVVLVGGGGVVVVVMVGGAGEKATPAVGASWVDGC